MKYANIEYMNNTKNYQSPVDILIEEFGGIRPLARAVGRNSGSIWKWSKSGLVPSNMQQKVLTVCWDKDLNVTPHDIIFGRN
tara:strand:+ start:4317 stop:4562 length:246 start_codon:yes stop_codon:yes gene_type:complete